jgi:hypothetical protein
MESHDRPSSHDYLLGIYLYLLRIYLSMNFCGMERPVV